MPAPPLVALRVHVPYAYAPTACPLCATSPLTLWSGHFVDVVVESDRPIHLRAVDERGVPQPSAVAWALCGEHELEVQSRWAREAEARRREHEEREAARDAERMLRELGPLY